MRNSVICEIIIQYLRLVFLVFFKEIIVYGLLGKTKHNAIGTESEERGSLPAHLLVWAFSAPNVQSEQICVGVI